MLARPVDDPPAGYRPRYDPPQIGLQAELAVKDKLEKLGYWVLHDVYLPHPDGHLTQIDLLALTADGVEVIEVKRRAGRVDVAPFNRFWNVTYRDGTVHAMDNPLWQNHYHIQALLNFDGGWERHPWFRSSVVFVDAELAGASSEKVLDGVSGRLAVAGRPAGKYPNRMCRRFWDRLRNDVRRADTAALRARHLAELANYAAPVPAG